MVDAISREILGSLLGPDVSLRTDCPISLQEGLEIGREYVSKRHPRAECAILFGSVARNDAGCLSDIDVMVFRDDAPLFLKEQIVVSGRMVQSVIANVPLCVGAIGAANSNLNAFFATAINDSIHLCGDESIFNYLLRESQKILSKELGQGSYERFGKFKIRSANTVVELIKSECPIETFDLMSTLVGATRDFIVAYYGLWLGNGPFVAEKLINVDQNNANVLYSSFQSAVKEGDKYILIDAVMEIYSKFDGIHWSTYNKPVQLF